MDIVKDISYEVLNNYQDSYLHKLICDPDISLNTHIRIQAIFKQRSNNYHFKKFVDKSSKVIRIDKKC